MNNHLHTHISFFDLDHTLITCNSSFLFGRFLSKEGVIPIGKFLPMLWYYANHKLGFLSISELHKKSVSCFFANQQYSTIKGLVPKFLDQYLNAIINKKVFLRLLTAHRQGHMTVIVSSSPDFLVEAIADRLSVDRWFATRYPVGGSGRFASMPHVIEGEDKRAYVNSLAASLAIPLKKTTGYSDSHLDIPFLSILGRAVAVDPDRKLLSAAKRNSWEVI